MTRAPAPLSGASLHSIFLSPTHPSLWITDAWNSRNNMRKACCLHKRQVMKKILNIHTRTESGRLVTTRLTESQVLKVSKMECKIVTIGLSRDDSPKRRSIRATENSVRVSSDDGTTKNTLWPPLHAICEWRMYVTRFIFEASDRISHAYKESYDVKIKFILITKAWKGNRVNKSALPVRHSTHWIIKLTMCLSWILQFMFTSKALNMNS